MRKMACAVRMSVVSAGMAGDAAAPGGAGWGPAVDVDALPTAAPAPGVTADGGGDVVPAGETPDVAAAARLSARSFPTGGLVGKITWNTSNTSAVSASATSKRLSI